jgi:hypothetical protein
MTKDEALRLALEALEYMDVTAERYVDKQIPEKAITAIKEALAQTAFIKHEVENADDWSEWVCPDPKNYLMKCCDCGLVHEAQFGVVRYKSETERDDCDMVNDPNLQAVFRMRRSEEWTPEDTAHRVGGLPMAKPVGEIVAWPNDVERIGVEWISKCPPEGTSLYTTPPQRTWVGLTDEEIDGMVEITDLSGAYYYDDLLALARAIEAKLKEKNT